MEDSLAGRTSDHHAQRRNDYQLQDHHSPYCASTSTSPIAAASTASTPQTLLNYLQMEQSGPSYLSNPQFSHAHHRTLTAQQPQQQYQQQPQEQLQRQSHLNEPIFNHTAKVVVIPSSSQVRQSSLLHFTHETYSSHFSCRIRGLNPTPTSHHWDPLTNCNN